MRNSTKQTCMTIVQNKKAFHDYLIEERYEAGIVLEGWEVKAIRAGRAQIKEGYVLIRAAELYLIGAHVTALPQASTHVQPDPVRTRKLLLHAAEIRKLIGKVERAGYTLIPLNFHYNKHRIKLEIGLAKGKVSKILRLSRHGRRTSVSPFTMSASKATNSTGTSSVPSWTNDPRKPARS
ncbi:MAG: SmpB protein [Pseudomonadota bacterium]